MNSKTSRTRTWLVGAAMLIAYGAAAPQAQAQVYSGTWQAAQCGTATTTFVTVPKGKGFGSGTVGATLVNAGVGTAGLQLLVPALQRGTFGTLRFRLRLSNTASAQNTNVHFCFANGKSFDRTLAQLAASRIVDGWQAITVTNGAFQGIRSSLVKLTFALGNTGNVTIGDTLVSNYGSANSAPTEIDLTVSDCSVLNNCNTVAF